MVSTWLHTIHTMRGRLDAVAVRTVVACAVACGIIVLVYGCCARSVQLIVLFILLAHAAFVDRQRLVIPNEIVLAIVGLRVVFVLLELAAGAGIEPLVQGLVAALVVSMPTLALALVLESVRGSSAFGGGDIKLLFVVSLHFCWYTALFGVFFACVIGAGVGIVGSLRAARGLRPEKRENASGQTGEEAKGNARGFPFAPAIAWGFFLSSL